jgi:hypothetical protein
MKATATAVAAGTATAVTSATSATSATTTAAEAESTSNSDSNSNSNSSSNSGTSHSKKKGLGGGVIAGIAVGAAAIVGLLAAVILFLRRQNTSKTPIKASSAGSLNGSAASNIPPKTAVSYHVNEMPSYKAELGGQPVYTYTTVAPPPQAPVAYPGMHQELHGQSIPGWQGQQYQQPAELNATVPPNAYWTNATELPAGYTASVQNGHTQGTGH